jgi:hypothetical protein
MNNLKLLPYFTAVVNGGSGCLFQPSDDSYSLVLTAKHALEDDLKIHRQTVNDEGELIIEPLKIIGSPFLHSDFNKDAAIIKVEKVKGIDSLLRDNEILEGEGGYFLSGHPEVRRLSDTLYSFRYNEFKVHHLKTNGYREGELIPTAEYGEVVGQSGGGIIRVEDGCILIAGIQSKMAVRDEKELLGKVDFMPLSFFDEIVAQNHAELSQLYPPYIASFDKLLNEIFPLPNFTGKTKLIQSELSVIAKELCEDFSPKDILEVYKDDFLVHGTASSLKQHKNLWLSFLELLAINQLHKEEKLTLDELDLMHKKSKLYIADTDEWTKKIEDIFRSDLSDIEKGGSVIICTTKDAKPTKTEISNDELLYDISLPISKGEMIISNTIVDPFKDISIKHIFKFQEHIINNTALFRDINATNSKEKLKNGTTGVI